MLKFVFSAASILTGLGLFLAPQLTAAAAAEGLRIAIDVLLPSLFPFMALSGFVCLSGAGDVLALFLRPVAKLLRIDNALSPVLLASFAGGYPSGALVVSSLVSEKKLSHTDAAAMMPMLVNSGPGFAVMAVGWAMAGSQRLGYILLAAQILSSLVIGFFTVRKKGVKAASPKKLPYGDALITGVSGATSAMITIGAYVILFSIAATLADHFFANQPWVAAFCAFFEVTRGCLYACSLGNEWALPLCAFILGFGGFSVFLQVASILKKAGISTKGLFFSRICAGTLTAVFTLLLSKIFGQGLAVSAGFSQPVAVFSANRMLLAVCICAMIAMVLNRTENLSI